MDRVAQTIVNGIMYGSVYASIALGFSLVYRVTRIINLSQGAYSVVGALIMFTLQQRLGLDMAVSALLAIVGVAALAAAIASVSVVPALEYLPSSSMMLITAGLLTALNGLVLVVWGNDPFVAEPLVSGAPLSIAGVRIPLQGILAVVAALVVMGLLWLLLGRTRIGKGLLSCAENPVAARLVGIDTRRMNLLSYTLAAVVGGIAGIVIAPLTTLQFDTGEPLTMVGFIAAAFGGMGSLVGAIVGGMALGLLEQFATVFVSSLFGKTITLALLLGVLFWSKGGLFSAGLQRRADLRDERFPHALALVLSRRAATWAAAIGAAIVLVLPFLLPAGAWLPSLVIILILFIAVTGLNVLMGYAGQISLGHAGFLAIGAYTAAIAWGRFGVPPLLGTLLGIVLSATVAALLAWLTLRLRGHYLALATLAFGLIIDSIILGLPDFTGGPSGLAGLPYFSVFGFELTSPLVSYYFLLALIGVLLFLLHNLLAGDFGRALKAIRADQTAAAALGIRVSRHKLYAFVISAAFGSLAGSLYAFNFRYLSPDMVSTTRSFEMITMLVVGGEGMLLGPLFGATVLSLLPLVMQSLVYYKTLVEGMLLVLTFRVLPQGLYGGLLQLIDRLSRGSGSEHRVPAHPEDCA